MVYVPIAPTHHTTLSTSKITFTFFRFGLLVWVFLTPAFRVQGQCSNAPDLVIINANIITMNPSQPTAGAMAIHDGIIRAIGDEDDIIAMIPED